MHLSSVICALVNAFIVVNAQGGTGDQHSTLVHTKYGSVRGRRATIGTDSHVDVFHNIPYAQPPVGNLRFEKPLPPNGWTDVRDASKPGAQCPQRHRNLLPSRVFVNDEDCLYLNVYRPKSTSGQGPMPVMVWVHGGSYYQSTGNYYDATPLADKGVVVVTINYRLDALGFFSLESGASPGNYGLWDMIRALEWVRDAISAFNGDPDNVTVFGESSGSTAVSLLVLTRQTQGLFTQAIMESGVSMTTWSSAHRGVWPEARVQARTLAKGLHCDMSDSAAMLACLRTKDAMAIVNVSTEMEKAAGDILFRPVIEETFGQPGLFSGTVRDLLEQGLFNSVTAMRGYNKYESSSVSDPDNDGITVSEFKSSLHDLVSWYVSRYSRLSAQDTEAALLEAYITAPNVTDPVDIRQAAMQLRTDYSFIAPTVEEMKLTVANNPHPQYLYQFSYRSSNRQSPQWQGAEHADELHYVFGSPVIDDFMWNGFATSWTDDDKRVSDDVMTLWTNFAKYGNPTPSGSNVTWLPWTPTSPNYMDIGVTDRPMSGLRAKQMSVWMDTILKPERIADIIG